MWRRQQPFSPCWTHQERILITGLAKANDGFCIFCGKCVCHLLDGGFCALNLVHGSRSTLHYIPANSPDSFRVPRVFLTSRWAHPGKGMARFAAARRAVRGPFGTAKPIAGDDTSTLCTNRSMISRLLTKLIHLVFRDLARSGAPIRVERISAPPGGPGLSRY